MTPISKLLIKIIYIYQMLISPLLSRPRCRFQTTCSQYGIQVINEFGVLQGTKKILIRILKCHPFTLKIKK